MFSSHDHTPAARPDGATRRPGGARGSRGPRRVAAALAALGILAVSVAAGAPASAATAAGEPTPPPPISAPAGEHALVRSDVDAWLDGFLPAALESAGIAGAVVSVVNDGEIVTARGYGHSETGTTGGEAVPVDAERTLFRPGSVSKLFTATAAMQLVESGDVDLDADINEYVDFDIPRTFDEPITLRHLLTHTAGFEERIGGLIGSGDVTVNLRDALATDPPEQIFRPGTVPAYSNYGNSLVGYIVERMSGMPFEEYVQTNVLDRAGMTSSTFVQPLPAELNDRMSQGYPTSSAAPGPFEIVGTPPAGSLTSSAPDMARFMLAQLGEPTSGEPLLQPETLDQMHAPALDEGSLGNLAAGSRMGLGFFDESRNGRRIVGHGGDTQYFHSHLQVYPEEGAGIFVALNSTGNGYASLTLREALLRGFADRYFPAGTAGSAADGGADGSAESGAATGVEPTAKEHAAIAEGTYVASRKMDSTFLAALDPFSSAQVVAQDDGRLLITPGPSTVTPTLYEEVEPWVWREVNGQRTIAMRVVDDRVQAIGYEGAFALLPTEPDRAPGVVLPVLIGSAVILVVTAVAWPVGAIARRVRRRTLPDGTGRLRPEGTGGVMRILGKVAVVSTVVALAGWTGVILTVMSLQDVPHAALRVLQVLQGIGVLGLIPAVQQAAGAIRHRHGWRRIAGTLLVALALAATAWLAIELRLLAPSVSY